MTFSFLSPVTNWSIMSQLIKRHLLEKSKHHDNMRMADDFMKVFQGISPSIASSLSKAHHESIAKNRHVISKVIEVILLCSRQNIPLIGHKEDHSNYHAILHTKAKTDAILAEHLAFSTDVKYTSPEIQNEIINICAKHVLNKLISSYSKAPLFAILADETQDKSIKVQFSVCIRYVETEQYGNQRNLFRFLTCQTYHRCAYCRHIVEIHGRTRIAIAETSGPRI